MRVFVDGTAGNHVADGRPGQLAHGDFVAPSREVAAKGPER
jgi:hypothetical protein